MDKDGEVTTYEYNELNQLVRAGEVEYTWDNAGNLVSQATTSGVIVATYTYDSYNRMVSASVNSSTGTLEQSYTYDYLGNRTSKTTDGVTTYYVTDLSSGYSQVLKATTGSDVIYYTRGFELISRNEGTEASYYLYDGGMSVRALADEDGLITDTYVFDAFGNETARTGSSENSYGFQGEQKDETGLYYLRARYMDPSTGTFTTMDTYAGKLSDPMSLHKYMFANSNPVKYCDPSGHFTMLETMLAVALVSELAAAVVYGVTVTTTDRIQYNSLGEAIAGSLSVAISAMALGLLFWMMYMVLAVIVSVAFAAVIFALFGIGMSALGIANGILDIKEGDKVLGWTEIIISVIFLLLSLKTLNEYNPITPNKRGAVRIGGFSDNGGNDNRTTDRTVHAWQARNDGNPTQPAGARPLRDFGVSSRSDFVGPEIPSNDGSTHGASTNSNPNCGLHGTSWHLEEGTELPQGLGFVPDGQDVNPHSSNGPGHCTIYPTDTMTVNEFNELFQRLPWIQD